MVLIPWGDLSDPGSGIPAGARAVGNAARGIACQLYQNFPRWLVGDYGGWGTFNAPRFLWDFICDPPANKPPEPPALPPFEGGQCCDVDYLVSVSATNSLGTSIVTFARSGKIQGLRTVTTGEGDSAFQTLLLVSGGGDCESPEELGAVTQDSVANGGVSGSIVSITRVDGNPDECGDPPRNWPDVVPPPDELNFPISINIDGVDIDFDVSIPYTNFNPDLSFNPEFNINIGDINLSLKPEGINFNFDFGGDPPRIPVGPDPRPPGGQPPPVLPPSGGPGNTVVCPAPDLSGLVRLLNEIFNEVNELEEAVNELLKCDRCELPPVGDPRYSVQTYSVASSGVIDTTRDGRFVTIELVDIPANPRFQEGFAAPDVYYAGWCAIGSDQFIGDRRAIRYQKMVFPVPEGHSNFTYTLYQGFTAIVKTYQLLRD